MNLPIANHTVSGEALGRMERGEFFIMQIRDVLGLPYKTNVVKITSSGEYKFTFDMTTFFTAAKEAGII